LTPRRTRHHANIAQISDLHFGRHDPAIAEALLGRIEEERPDLVVVSGDFTQRARSSEFRAAKAFLERVAAPKLVVPGNHDVPLYDLLGRLFNPSRDTTASSGRPGCRARSSPTTRSRFWD
jgi:3',5'-cyclic AMP phosphodiesterase CpdA